MAQVPQNMQNSQPPATANVTIDQVMGDFYNKQQASNRTVESLIANLLNQMQTLRTSYDVLLEKYTKAKSEHPEAFTDKKEETPKTQEKTKNN